MPQKQVKTFSNILDYITWRGDLSFEQSPMCEVDGLVFSMLSYVEYDGIVPSAIQADREPQTLLTVAKRYLKSKGKGSTPSQGMLAPHQMLRLLVLASKSKRFGLSRPLCYANRISSDEEKQFSATVFLLSCGDVFVSFRGTDDTLIGWKENFNMSFMYPIPAQKEALSFLEDVAKKTSGRLYLGGHSKGGNLAVYAAVKALDVTKERIEAVYSNDSPGFSSNFIDSRQYRDMRKKIHTYLPQSSVVGMLLEHEEEYTVVKSKNNGLLQHDAFSWEVVGNKFIYLDSISDGSRMIDRKTKQFLSEMTKEERERFVDSIFDAIASQTGAKTVSELTGEKLKLFRVWGALDDSSKAQLKRIVPLIVGKKKQEKKKQEISIHEKRKK